MNLREYTFYAGGPGSGCHGDNCGRPAGHTGPHIPEGGKKTWIQQQEDKKLKEKWFKKERRRLGLRESRSKYPSGLTEEALRKLQEKEKEKAGTTTRQERRDLAKSGQLVDLSKKGAVLKTETSRVIERKVEKIQIGKRKYNVEVEVVKPVGGAPTPAMGKVRGKNVEEGPPERAHSLWGQFAGAIKIDVPEEKRRTLVYDAARGNQGAGATVFVHKETEGNKSRVVIQEVKRGDHGHIEETRQYTFGSGKVAKDYLGQRYGIKKVRWTG